MDTIYLNKKVIDNLEPISSKNKGQYGSCYKYNGKVLKVFKNELSPYLKSNIKRNLKRESDIIMYPKDRVYVDDKYGYICNIAPGNDLSSIMDFVDKQIYDLSFDKLLSAFYDEFLEKLNKEKILLEDVKPSHIFIDDSMTLIDSDLYRKVPIFMTDKTRKELNLLKVNDSVISLLEYFLPESLSFNYKDNKKDYYLYKNIDNIKKISFNEIYSLKSLMNYNFDAFQINELRKMI